MADGLVAATTGRELRRLAVEEQQRSTAARTWRPSRAEPGEEGAVAGHDLENRWAVVQDLGGPDQCELETR